MSSSVDISCIPQLFLLVNHDFFIPLNQHVSVKSVGSPRPWNSSVNSSRSSDLDLRRGSAELGPLGPELSMATDPKTCEFSVILGDFWMISDDVN